MQTVGIIGVGVVGNAFHQALTGKNVAVKTYDINGKGTVTSIKHMCADCSLIFLCLPTLFSEKKGTIILRQTSGGL